MWKKLNIFKEVLEIAAYLNKTRLKFPIKLSQKPTSEKVSLLCTSFKDGQIFMHKPIASLLIQKYNVRGTNLLTY